MENFDDLRALIKRYFELHDAVVAADTDNVKVMEFGTERNLVLKEITDQYSVKTLLRYIRSIDPAPAAASPSEE